MLTYAEHKSCVIKVVFFLSLERSMLNKYVSFFKKEKEKGKREWEGELVYYHLVRAPETSKSMSHQISQGKGY